MLKLSNLINRPKKLNTKGISHLLIPLIVVVIGVAAFGTYKLVSSSAASRPSASWIGPRGEIRKYGSDNAYYVYVKSPGKKSFAYRYTSVTIGGKKAYYQHGQGKGAYARYMMTNRSNAKSVTYRVEATYKNANRETTTTVARPVTFR